MMKFHFKILFLSLCCIFFACQKDNLKKVQILTNQKIFPSESGKNIEFYYSDSAKVRVKLKAPLMETYNSSEPYIEMSKGVELTFYDDSGSPKGYLRANYAIRYPNKRIMEVKNDVVVVNVKGDTLTTEELTWDEAKAKIFTERFCIVKTKDEIIKSMGLESNETFSKYTFKHLTGTIKLKTGSLD